MHTYQRIIDCFHTNVIFPNKYFLDKKELAKYKEVIKKNGMEYELVPPHMHRQDLKERKIQTFKYKFVVILRDLSASFPWLLWYKLPPQVEININMLRQSNVDPFILSYAYLNGTHD